MSFLAFVIVSNNEKSQLIFYYQVLRDKDSDGNGELSFQEYVGVRGQDKDKEWLIEEKDRFDNELDKNGDNVLSKDEILAWIIPSNEEIAKEEVIKLF